VIVREVCMRRLQDERAKLQISTESKVESKVSSEIGFCCCMRQMRRVLFIAYHNTSELPFQETLVDCARATEALLADAAWPIRRERLDPLPEGTRFFPRRQLGLRQGLSLRRAIVRRRNDCAIYYLRMRSKSDYDFLPAAAIKAASKLSLNA
jgi:hypothetical protein